MPTPQINQLQNSVIRIGHHQTTFLKAQKRSEKEGKNMNAIHLKPIVTDAEIFQKEENQNNKEIIVKDI